MLGNSLHLLLSRRSEEQGKTLPSTLATVMNEQSGPRCSSEAIEKTESSIGNTSGVIMYTVLHPYLCSYNVYVKVFES